MKISIQILLSVNVAFTKCLTSTPAVMTFVSAILLMALTRHNHGFV